MRRWCTLSLLLFACDSRPAPSSAVVPAPTPSQSPIDSEAIETAKSVRKLYPILRLVESSQDKALACHQRASGKQQKECTTIFDAFLDEVAVQVDPALAGCPKAVAEAAATGVAAWRAERGTPVNKRVGGFTAFHSHPGYMGCVKRLFLTGLDRISATPPTAPQLEGQLGLRDDEEPGPATFSRNRPGGLWTATGKEIERSSLTIGQ